MAQENKTRKDKRADKSKQGKAPKLTPKQEPPKPPRVVVAYSWDSAIQQFRTDEFVIDRGEIRLATSPAANHFLRRNIDRLVLYSLKGSREVLLVLDVIPDDHSSIELVKTDALTTLTARVKVRCVLNSRGYAGIEILLERKSHRAANEIKYTRFQFFNVTITNSNANILEVPRPEPQSSAPVRLRDLDDALAALKRETPIITTPSNTGQTLSSKFVSEIGLRLAPRPCPPSTKPRHETTIYFTPINKVSAQRPNENWYVIRFRLNAQDGSKCRSDDTEHLLSFRSHPNLRVDKDLLQQDWELLQYPLLSITTDPKAAPKVPNSPASLWVVRLHGIPAASIPPLWETFVAPYHTALNTVLSGRPVSFLPSLDKVDESPGGNPGARWAMAYLLDDPTTREDPDFTKEPRDDNDKATVSGLSLQPTESSIFIGSIKQLKSHEDKAVPVVLHVISNIPIADSTGRIQDDLFENNPGIVIRCGRPLTSPDQPDVRMGAMDLKFARERADSNSNENRFFVRRQGDFVAVRINADFAIARISPGGQDDLPGEEFVQEGGANTGTLDDCAAKQSRDPNSATATGLTDREIERGFIRKSPIIVAVKPTSTDADRFLLNVSEVAQDGSSQTLRLNLQNQSIGSSTCPNPQDKCEQVIVLDRNPFLVALVEYVPFSKQRGTDGGSSIGNWTNAGLEGTSWQLMTRAQPLNLVLPPQSVGEEMEKGFPTDGAGGTSYTIEDNRAVDFRLSQPARLELDPSPFRQNFSEAPWNLRRILGYPGQRDPGAGIRHLQFELIYGLSCDVTYPFLRLAEISALIGGVPGRLEPVLRWEGTSSQTTAYRVARSNWSNLYRRLLSRVAVLEPWDTHKQDTLVINDRIVCRIRSSSPNRVNDAELRHPIDKVSPETDRNLRGGVTWGFESKNVYNAVMRPGRTGNPESSSASVADLYFSSLGAWGRQKASFDEDRSTIYADTAMGRNYFYKIERIGRIAIWWNKAKHVIVYERTVVPSRQFKDEQPRHEGRPIVRKVKEYIEILDAIRHYPEEDPATAGRSIEELKRQRGFVSHCAFAIGAKFNVSSAWGTDVGNIGWKVPLWNPAATPADVYPKPDVKVGLMSNVNGARAAVPCSFKRPQELYFFTDTRPQTGSDPDEWPAVKDVDYSDRPRPKAMDDFEEGKPIQSTPDDPALPPGFLPCTFTLEHAIAPTDLVAERTGKPLSAILETITMMRASAIEKQPDRNTPNIDSIEKLNDLSNGIADAYKKILIEIPTQPDAVNQAIADRLKQLVQTSFASGPFKKATDDIRDIRAVLLAKEEELRRKIRAREEELFASLTKQVGEVTDLIVTEYDRINGQISSNVDEFKDAVNHQLRVLQEGVLLLRASPGMLQKLVARYAFAADRLIKETSEEARKLLVLIEGLSDPLTAEELNNLKARVRRLLVLAEEISKAIEQAGLRRPEEWIPDPTIYIDENFLADLKREYAVKKALLEAELLSVPTLTKARARRIIQGVRDWEATTTARIEDLKRQCDALLEKKMQELATAWIQSQEELVRQLPQTATPAEMRALLNQLRDRISRQSTMVVENIFAHLNRVKGQVEAQTAALIEWPINTVRRLQDELNGLSQQSVEALLNNVARLRERIEQQRDKFFAHANDYLDKNIRRLLPEKENLYAAGDKAMRIVRAFGRPPEVPNLHFDRPVLAYFYKEADQRIGLTPVLSRVNQARNILNDLKPLGVTLPTKDIAERLLPAKLQNFKLSDVLPDFAGLKLGNLFSGLKLPEMSNDNVKVSHGVDPQSQRAWVEANVDVRLDQPATVFTAGPISLRLTTARFQASARIEAGLNEPPKRIVTGQIIGDWEAIVANQTLVIFRKTALQFDDAGGIRFGLSPKNVELPGILSFVAEFVRSYAGPDSGFSLGLIPTGFQALLNLPIPDFQIGVFGISNLRLGLALTLQFADAEYDGQFTIALSFLLARKEAPFALTIFILGGGGYVEMRTTYAPALQQIACVVEVGITACASLAISLGPIHGGVYVYFGVTARFATNTRAGGGDNGLTIGIMFLIRGEVSILGIVTASVSLLLEATYSSGHLVGRGRLSIKIKICWCFTLEVNEEVSYEIGAGSQRAAMGVNPDRLIASNFIANAGSLAERGEAPGFMPLFADEYDRLAGLYIDMFA